MGFEAAVDLREGLRITLDAYRTDDRVPLARA